MPLYCRMSGVDASLMRLFPQLWLRFAR